nr:protein FAM26F [Pogona vitticeps]
MEKVHKVLDFFLSHQKALGYGAISLLTIGSERIFSVAVFKCPCNSWNMLYGAVFLLVPAFILFLLGMLLKTRSWKVLTGCCATSRMGRCPHSSRFCRYLQVLWLEAASAAVAPFTWIAVALLGGSFYECAATGNSIVQQQMCKGKTEEGIKECLEMVPKVPCDTSASPSEMQNMLTSLRAQSQVIGWILIAIVFTLVLAGTCISRCRSPVSILQLAFWKIYMEKESQLFEVKAKEHAVKLAERNLKCFFDSTELEPFETPSSKAWHGVSSLFAFNPEQHYYSMIHKYVTCKSKSGSIRSTEGDTFPMSLGFVDAAGVALTEPTL